MKYVKKVADLHAFTNLRHKSVEKVVFLHFLEKGEEVEVEGSGEGDQSYTPRRLAAPKCPAYQQSASACKLAHKPTGPHCYDYPAATRVVSTPSNNHLASTYIASRPRQPQPVRNATR
ncbi:hypothetical protein PAECIP111891_06121 [Paenibacillus allorhizoplanae]|uniref:Uncharacterized protein n=1 Tax=Paenibacillus allorhizoplanae TaxID=2905648 RepID=A0ABN8H8S0_9BACL|nr:hypothetical protein [Paenibacillus allorhizoplanae]CAH1227318.1 hypothetical protein PAECIP111891_06121 [Paenibacillus allorhizoplanae]